MAVSRLFARRRRGGYRGSLRYPLIATIEQLDTVATMAAGNYDRAFKSFVPGRGPIYKPLLTLHCQVEMGPDRTQVRTQMGDVPDSMMTLVFLAEELEILGLVDASGMPTLRKNDRLLRMAQLDGKTYRVYDPPLYATQVADAGQGLAGMRNLITVTWEDRPQGLSVS